MNTVNRQTETSKAPVATQSPTVLRASGLRKAFGGQVVLDEVDLELRRGHVVLLDGENGAGKSTLLNILTGNLEPDAGSITYSTNGHERQFRFPQSWLNRINPVGGFASDTVARLGIVRTWQDARLFDSMSLHDNIAVAKVGRGENPLIALFSWSMKTDEHESEQLLAQLGLAGREQSSADMISLGQSKRVAIAAAVNAGAKILFLDEPLAGLDRKGIDEVLHLLSDLVSKHGITLVVIEHAFNQSYLHGLVTEHWRLFNGKLSFEAPDRTPTTQTPDHPLWFQLLSETADEVITHVLPRGAKLTRFRINRHYQPNPILTIEDLVVRRGKHTVIGLDDKGDESGFSLTINEGEISVLQAPNGWGKSTVMGAVIGSIAVIRGKITLCGDDTFRNSLPTWKRVKAGMVFVPAQAKLFGSLTVREYSCLTHSSPKSNDYIDQTIGTLSGGQRQSLAMGAGLATQGKVYLFDEPFNALDGANYSEVIATMLKVIPNSGMLIAEPERQNNGC